MVQVLGYVTYQTTCNTCDAILSYTRKDVKKEECGSGFAEKFIQCPNCLGNVYVESKLH